MSDIKMYDGHGRCYSADQIAQIARFIEGGRPEGLRLYPINGAPGRFLVDAEQFDAQRLRADTAEAERDALRLVFENAEDCELNDAEQKLAAAEQRIEELEAALTEITPWAKGVGSKALKSRIYSMLNIKSCEKCLGAGFIGFDNTELRSLNGGAWGRCLACRPYTIDAALNQKSE